MTSGRPPAWGDVSGAVADLGIFIPLTAALVLVNGLSAGMVLLVAGVFIVVSGLRFRIPFPVQPLKALTAVAVARQLSPDVIAAAGLMIGLVLLAVSVRGAADRVAAWFSPTAIRALQFGVGLLLLVTAARLAVDPPAVFASPPPAGASPLTPVIPVLPGWSAFATALVLLVIPQLPLTFGNAVVAVTDVAKRSFGPRAAAVTPSAVCRNAGWGNVAAALAGGMPMCHGSSGLTAHHRLGARTAAMNVVLGSALVVIAGIFGDQAPAVLGQVPPLLLALLLAYAGLRHALLVADLRGARLVLAVTAGAAGAVLGNLAVTLAVVLTLDLVARLRQRAPRELRAEQV